MSNSNRFKLDPNIVNMVSQSKATNAGQAISKMFTDLGTIENQKANQELAQVQADTKKLQYQSVADTMSDQKLASEYMQSDSADLNTWLEDNNKSFKTPEWQLKAQTISDGKMDKVYDDSLAAHENYLKEQGLYTNTDGTVNIAEIRKQLAKDPQNIYLAQAFERKYGTKLNKPREELSLQDKLDLQKTQSEIDKNKAQADKYNRDTGSSNKDKFVQNLDYLVLKGKITQERADDLRLQYATKETQPNLTALAKDIETANSQTDDFIKYLGNKDINKYNLSTADVREFNPEQKAQAERLANIIIRAEKPAMKEAIAKDMADLSVMQSQLNDSINYTISAINEGRDINTVDKVQREYLNKYLGMTDNQLETAFRDSRFQSASNTLLKVMSGTAVSGQEWERFKQATGTLYQTNETLVNGMLSMVRDQKNRMRSMSNSMGGTAFNLKYGSTYRDILDMEQTLIDSRDTKKTEEEAASNPIYDPSKNNNTTEPTTTPQNKPSWRDYAN
ncbi:hypothetical protein [Halarcobacter anaerophilus]|uniref:Uncharacterized protein n=1 Tax=Halarcobacter anaerophilus TaxID=877500 RepID=A0A4V1LQ63_9BACT|nr:hypothetical protein [Halarcobacter anaerophilus]QDF28963.1 hypothetical protein AANAER_1483 [Halarcobacter anaerophilus]RXJ63598.1 hypothetical protein CRV06_05240 [Halarcobacter anaerophilus]